MGAWIEITGHLYPYMRCKVAPLVGAWIEITVILSVEAMQVVAPLVGAWIEITPSFGTPATVMCRSSRGSVD